ncbi:MAG: type II 3-dehydroquinate dehydratase [Chloroflexi bacterium]|nr:type II 3-dehydroquinate dehydratase [Chloroflexota bacterium]
MKYLVIQGPNLNWLGKRDPKIYGKMSLAEIHAALAKRAKELGAQVVTFQSNHEGAIVDFIQKNGPTADGVIINPGAYLATGYAIADALLDQGKPVAEVHLSNVHARDEWRRKSVIASIAKGVIVGFGWRGYIAALELLVAEAKQKG